MELTQFLEQARHYGMEASVHPWIEAKKVKSSDLAFLSPLKTELQWQLFFKGLKLVIDFRTSYTDSLKLLEMFSDLILMGHEETLFEFSHDLPNWTSHVKALRYPSTMKRDDELKTKLEKLPWPYGAKTKFERRGDRAGIELKMFITSQADLIKAISALERVKEQISE
jgi:hypothetical protein